MRKKNLIQRMNKVLTEKDFKEIEVTDRWGGVVPMGIEEKKNWIRVFSLAFPGLFDEEEDEKWKTINK